jgi:hypothetical protein
VDEIYVQIPAYRDAELSRTLLDLYRKAAVPERLRVRVMWQRGENEPLDDAVHGLPRLEIVEVPASASRGCNWARNLLQREWRGETYTLLLDSHHRFARNWDVTCEAMYRSLRAGGVSKPLLTAYLPAYDPRHEPGWRKRQPYRIYPLGREKGVLTRLTSYPIPNWTSLEGPIEASFLSLHFIFAAGTFNREIVFDPGIYFFGDEVLTGARAFTAGYDLFHPHQILGWHCYDRRSRVPHWNDHASWRDAHARSLARIRAVLGGRRPGRYGLGQARSVAEYEDRIMIRLVEASS